MSHAPQDTLDTIAADLQAMRLAAGTSYRALAVAVSDAREAAGQHPAAAQIAHSTIADAFRTGRSRINASLVGEIVAVLGGDAEQWRARCVQAMSIHVEVPVTEPAAKQPATQTDAIPAPNAARNVLIVVLAALFLNAVGKFFNPLLGDVIFLDMIGTATAALLLGPWVAAIVGVLFIAFELLKGNVGDALFAITMVTAAIVWGSGARFGYARTIPRWLGVSVIVALTTSLVAVPITMLYFGGRPGRGFDQIFATYVAQDDPWFGTAFINVAVSLADKLIVGVIALLLARAVARGWPRVAQNPLS